LKGFHPRFSEKFESKEELFTKWSAFFSSP
jgi:hypothetical protein